MVNERTFYKMSKLKNGISASKKDAEDREENHPDRQFTTGILDSSACRRILPWAMPQRSDATLRAADQQLSEQQKRRWNFDFLTETPLPGRYEWIRTDCSNGHDQKNTTTSRSTIKNGEVKNRSSREYRFCFFYMYSNMCKGAPFGVRTRGKVAPLPKNFIFHSI